ncbi:hypothetical protein B0H14DRAFT_2864098 [Mycena olivaceomarginata]|nr:hypothetical protein B0H14DRAFT_2864098 [Mycena olivaceomarginata]
MFPSPTLVLPAAAATPVAMSMEIGPSSTKAIALKLRGESVSSAAVSLGVFSLIFPSATGGAAGGAFLGGGAAPAARILKSPEVSRTVSRASPTTAWSLYVLTQIKVSTYPGGMFPSPTLVFPAAETTPVAMSTEIGPSSTKAMVLKLRETYGSVAAGFHVTRSVPSAGVSLGVFSLMPITDGSTQANKMLKKKNISKGRPARKKNG